MSVRRPGILSPRATFAEVTFNGTPWGFYTVVEQIDDQFLDRSIGDDEGHLFKAGSNFLAVETMRQASSTSEVDTVPSTKMLMI